MSYSLIVAFLIQGHTVFEEFQEFASMEECRAVQAAWMNVPVTRGHVALAACMRVRA